MNPASPLQPGMVTIGIPTYNRAHLLGRSVASALGQSYAPLEIIISDNGSTDGTDAMCRDLADRHLQLRYIRGDVNAGAVANFERVLRAAQGEYFMWLADDDWVEPNYVSVCAKTLRDDPRVHLVAGRIRYCNGSETAFHGERINIVGTSSPRRVITFYQTVRFNGVLYGLSRTAIMTELLPLKNGFGRDWMMSAYLAYRGHVLTLPETMLHRSVGGMSSDLVRQLGLSDLRARFPFGCMVIDIGTDILLSPLYQELGRIQRLWLTIRCEIVTVRRLLLRPRASALVRRLLPDRCHRWARLAGRSPESKQIANGWRRAHTDGSG